MGLELFLGYQTRSPVNYTFTIDFGGSSLIIRLRAGRMGTLVRKGDIGGPLRTRVRRDANSVSLMDPENPIPLNEGIYLKLYRGLNIMIQGILLNQFSGERGFRT